MIFFIAFLLGALVATGVIGYRFTIWAQAWFLFFVEKFIRIGRQRIRRWYRFLRTELPRRRAQHNYWNKRLPMLKIKTRHGDMQALAERLSHTPSSYRGWGKDEEEYYPSPNTDEVISLYKEMKG